jgi:hypothetical protein
VNEKLGDLAAVPQDAKTYQLLPVKRPTLPLRVDFDLASGRHRAMQVVDDAKLRPPYFLPPLILRVNPVFFCLKNP